MSKIRLATKEELEILKTKQTKSTWSLGVLFYIMGILLPLMVCMIITGYFAYLYIFLIGIIFLLFKMIIYPILWKKSLEKNSCQCFESEVLNCKKSDFYYYTVEILGLDGNFIDYRYPVFKRIKKGMKITVAMPFGKNKKAMYYLLNSEKNELLTSKRTRFDLID